MASLIARIGPALALVLLAGASDARAQYGAEATVEQPIAATHAGDPTAAATEIPVRDRPAAAERASDLVMDVPGARPLRTGVLGSFTSASLRGAQADHTAVLLGDLPIGGADAGAFNLDTIPTAVLESIVAYRGGAPLWVSQGAIGGVLQLNPRRARGTELAIEATAGSFGMLGLAGSSAVVPDDRRAPRVLGAVGAVSSDGDFPFRFDNKTALDTADDYTAERRNADTLDGHALLHVTQPLGPGALELVALGFERIAGEPGSPADPLLRVRRNVVRGIAATGYTIDRRLDDELPHRAQLLAGGTYERTRIADPLGELDVGGGGRTDARKHAGFGRLAGSLALLPWLEATAIASARRDGYELANRTRLVALPPSHRDTLAGAGELRAHGRLAGLRAELRPSLRLAHHRAELSSERFASAVRTDADTTVTTLRLAAVIEPVRDVALSASAATGARVPTMLELFGDGAALDGNTTLRNERARSYDVGLVWRGELGPVSGSSELRGFRLDIRDQIIFIRKSENELVGQNQASSHILGLEWGERLRITRHLHWSSALTLLDTEGKLGKRLVNRPRVVAHVRPELRFFGLPLVSTTSVFGELNVISASFDDPDNVGLPKPSQAFVDAGLSLQLLGGRTELRLTARNLGDVRGSDIRGFQLPGRSLWASLTYRETS